MEPIDASRTLADATDVVSACEALADLLVAHGYDLPSLYLLRGGRLRCYACRGYWQVIDGFAPGVGVIGKVLTSGRPALVPDASLRDDFIAAIPGLRGEASVPIDLDGETIGVLTVETFDVLPPTVIDVLSGCADALADRLCELGGLPARSPEEVLADHVVALSKLTDVAGVTERIVATAQQLAGMDTVLLALRTDDGTGPLELTGRSGPLAGPLASLAPDDLEVVAEWVAHGTSCYFAGGTASAAHELFLRAGARSVLVLPLTTRGSQGGVLIIVDAQVVQPAPEQVKLLEQLAAHGAATLRSFETAEHLRQLAYTDALTGVGSVTSFAIHRDELAGDGGPQVVCLVDVDHFKSVNDTYGHVAGDELLREVADIIVTAVGPEGRVFRHGGDEFIAVRPGDEAVAGALGARLCDVARSTGRFTLSVGVTVAASVDDTALAVADSALYEVKRRGRDGHQVVVHDRTMGEVFLPSRGQIEWAVPARLVDEIHEVVFTTDLGGRWTFLNRAWEDLVGVGARDSLGDPLEAWVHADDLAGCRDTMAALLSGASANARAQWRWTTATGGIRWCELWARPLRLPTGDVIGAAGTLTDVTARRAAEQALRTQLGLSTVISGVLERFAGLDGAADIDRAVDDALARVGRFAGVDRSYLFRFASDMSSMTNTHEWCADGITPQIDRLEQVPVALVADWLPSLRVGRAVHVPRVADLPARMADLRASLEAQSIRSLVIVPLLMANRLIGFLGFDAVTHERAWSEQQIDLLRLVANALVSVVSRHDATEKLSRQALTDPLTGLPNRASLLACLQQELDQADRPPPGVILVDLDAFRVVNDSLGHDAGDDALRGVADRLSDIVRDTDVLARIGGDQFAIVCPGLDGPLVAEQIARRVREVVRTPAVVRDVELYVTASIGVATAEGHSLAGALLHDAEAAMRRARTLGRDRIEIFHEALRPDVARRLELAVDLRRAIDDEQLHLVYQPIVDLRCGRTVGAEALVRWQHPGRGLLGPAQFIDTAEGTGQILTLGRWVLSRACHQLAAWRASGADDLKVNVNVSALQLADPGFVDTIAEATARAGVPAGALTLELTESTLMSDITHTVTVLRQLKDLGVNLAVDDFGTGFSSLSYLRRFALDQLKIDRSFIGRLGGEPADDAMVAAICGLGRALGLDVVAEGVEHAAQRSALLALDCGLAQGYWISRPIDADGFHTAMTTLEARLH